MVKKKDHEKGPFTFVEWCAGTSLENVQRHNRPKTPSLKRDVFRINLCTDDERETDTLHVTYPRTGRTKTSSKASDKATEQDIPEDKKVRFNSKPSKSALKKTTNTVTKKLSDSGTEAESEEENEKGKLSRKTKNKKKKQQEEDSEDEQPHHPCKCIECIRKRTKTKRQGKDVPCTKNRAVKTSESEDSESDVSEKKGNKKRAEKQKGNKDGSSSAEESESEPLKRLTEKERKAARQVKKAEVPEESDDDGALQAKGDGKKQKIGKKQEVPNSSKKRQEGNKMGTYHEGILASHPRRPHFLEPTKAETIRTERVVEGPEDPKPNAYFDAEHNILRVYHGPVYGGNHSQSLYPKRDPNNKPLPVGQIHPNENPWFNGFPKDSDGNNVPTTQGMPFNSMNYPLNMMPGHYGSYLPPMPPGYPPYPAGPPPLEGGYNRGAFAHMSGTNGPGDEKRSASNNVGPSNSKPLEGEDNPYYQAAKSKLSQFSNWGSQRGNNGSKNAPSDGAGASNGSNKGWGGNNGSNKGSTNASHSNKGAQDTWGGINFSSNNGHNAKPGSSGNNSHRNPLGNKWDKGSHANTDISRANTHGRDAESFQLSGQQDSWPYDSSHFDGKYPGSKDQNGSASGWTGPKDGPQTNVTDHWNGNHVAPAWGEPDKGSKGSPRRSSENNVAPVETMPGSWDTVPAWGDPTAAATTGGAFDNEVNDPLPEVKW